MTFDHVKKIFFLSVLFDLSLIFHQIKNSSFLFLGNLFFLLSKRNSIIILASILLNCSSQFNM